MSTDPSEQAFVFAGEILVAIHNLGGLNPVVFGNDDGIMEACITLMVAEIVQGAIDSAMGDKNDADVPKR